MYYERGRLLFTNGNSFIEKNDLIEQINELQSQDIDMLTRNKGFNLVDYIINCSYQIITIKNSKYLNQVKMNLLFDFIEIIKIKKIIQNLNTYKKNLENKMNNKNKKNLAIQTIDYLKKNINEKSKNSDNIVNYIINNLTLKIIDDDFLKHIHKKFKIKLNNKSSTLKNEKKFNSLLNKYIKKNDILYVPHLKYYSNVKSKKEFSNMNFLFKPDMALSNIY